LEDVLVAIRNVRKNLGTSFQNNLANFGASVASGYDPSEHAGNGGSKSDLYGIINNVNPRRWLHARLWA